MLSPEYFQILVSSCCFPMIFFQIFRICRHPRILTPVYHALIPPHMMLTLCSPALLNENPEFLMLLLITPNCHFLVTSLAYDVSSLHPFLPFLLSCTHPVVPISMCMCVSAGFTAPELSRLRQLTSEVKEWGMKESA